MSATAAALGADTLDGLRLNRALKAGILKPGTPLPRTAPAYPFACA